MTLASLVSLAPAAQAKIWRVTVNPRRVAQGGSVVIKTGRRCKLTISRGRSHWHYQLPPGGERFDFSKSASPGRDYVSVNCGGRVKRSNFTIVAAQHTPTPAPGRTPAPPPTPAPPASVRTPVTVANVCSENPGLGAYQTTLTNGWPTAYWTSTSGQVTLALFEEEPSGQEVGVVFASDGSIAYFAYCNWPSWLTVAQYVAAQGQTGNPSASNLGTILQEQTDDSIYEEEADWFKPTPGYETCPADGPYPGDDCYYGA
jgi:hypothetical protein